MSPMEKWNEIVELYRKNLHNPEAIVQNLWENIFAELLGYRKLGGEIERHRQIRIGSTERVITDIIIRSGISDLFVVELKQHNMPIAEGMEKQLLSYLRQLRLDIGILVCEKICIINYDHSKADDEQNKVEIDFTENNQDGIKFIELFSKGAFSKSAVCEYIEQKKKANISIIKIKEEITTELAINLLRDYFLAKYDAEEFEQAIKEFNINISLKNNIPYFSPNNDTVIPLRASVYNPIGGKDTTRYQFNGRVYPKNRLVLAVIQDYVNRNPNMTVRQILLDFQRNLQGSLGVVREENEIKRECRDYNVRFFAQPHDIIRLIDGNVLVCTQWGIGNFPQFIERAKNLGFDINAIK